MSGIAIFVALPEELEHAIGAFERQGAFIGKPREKLALGQDSVFAFDLDKSGDEAKEITIYLIKGMGHVKAAAFASGAMSRPESGINLALLVGISGSLTDDVKLGDVVVSRSVKHYAPDKLLHVDSSAVALTSAMRAEILAGSRPLPSKMSGQIVYDDRDKVYGDNVLRFLREHVQHPDPENLMERLARSHRGPFSVHLGTILGSHWVVDSPTYVNYFKQKDADSRFDFYTLNQPTDVSRNSWLDSPPIAVDMESFGFFRAIDAINKLGRSPLRAFAVRGISDLSSGKSQLDSSSSGGHRKAATENAATAAIALCREYISRRSRTVRI